MKAKQKAASKEAMLPQYETEFYKIKQENSSLREALELIQKESEILQKKLESFKAVPLLVAEVKSTIDNNAIIKLSNGNVFMVNIMPSISGVRSGDSVLVEQKNLTIVKRIPTNKEFNVENFLIIEKPKVKWEEVGGLSEQANEIKEVIELPLKNPELFKKIGITPPKGILLYGPPGTGKTLLAKAVASSTNSTFIEIVSSELVQKFIGEGAKLVREIFELAKQKAPSIVFIDELDALASVRIDIGTSGEREVQRTFMQLLSEIDGFKPLGDVKIIGCTNRADLLDPAIMRPGRLDRKIEIPNPNEQGRKEIFLIHTKTMSTKGVNADEIVKAMPGFSGAEIKAVATEAGYFAIRANKQFVSQDDFLKAIRKVRKDEADDNEAKRMFG